MLRGMNLLEKRLASGLSDRIAAIAPVSGSMGPSQWAE